MSLPPLLQRTEAAAAAWLARPAHPLGILLPLAWAGIIYGLSAIPGTVETPEGGRVLFEWLPPDLQNLLHIPVFAVLAALLCRALVAWPLERRSVIAIALLATAAWGVLDEWHQASVPGRYSSLTDVILDGIGAAAGAWIYTHLRYRRLPAA